MKAFALAALFATVSAGTPPAVGLGHAYIPATREDYDNAHELWGGDWKKYRAAHPNDQDCGISESDNWKGAQQVAHSIFSTISGALGYPIPAKFGAVY